MKKFASLYSRCFEIPEAGHVSVASRSGCSGAKPTARTGFGIMIVFILFAVGCSSQKVPEEFPQKLVDFNIKLLNEGKPVQNAALAMVSESAAAYNVVGFTDNSGVAKFETSVNTYKKIGVPPTAYKVIITYTPKVASELSNEQLGKMSIDEVNAYREKVEAEIAAMPKIVPAEWGNLESTPVKITVPENGGNITIEITDSKTHQQ
ncbi:MAG: hypothetical protein LBJ00_00015 [Planctomycetaceae bacterium]|jgi:hypothetical protein|nr:hypothetical protein [Planctomycetaceae bacterium]